MKPHLFADLDAERDFVRKLLAKLDEENKKEEKLAKITEGLSADLRIRKSQVPVGAGVG